MFFDEFHPCIDKFVSSLISCLNDLYLDSFFFVFSLITTFCKQINSPEDVYFENLNEDQTGLNTPCESKVVAHDDHDAGFSPKKFEENVRKHLSLELIIYRFLFVFFYLLILSTYQCR
jgi:hypothetical protein